MIQRLLPDNFMYEIPLNRWPRWAMNSGRPFPVPHGLEISCNHYALLDLGFIQKLPDLFHQVHGPERLEDKSF
jgi:hypothetical protein